MVIPDDSLTTAHDGCVDGRFREKSMGDAIGAVLPLAVGIGEAASYRKSMGVAILGGVILSTFITLVVVPAIYEWNDRLRARIERLTLSEATIAEAAELIRKDAADKMDAVELQSCVEEKKAEKAAAKAVRKIETKPKRK